MIQVSTRVTHAVWLDDSGVCSIEHLAEVSGLSVEDIHDLVDSGVIAPVAPAAGEGETLSFHLQCVTTVKTARRLRDDFELDRRGVAIALVLLRRIRLLESELQGLAAAENANRQGG